jgi:hypothetical protein
MDANQGHVCPYCGTPLARGAMPPVFVAETTRDCTVGFCLGLAVVLFMDIGVFVRRDPTPFGFVTNVAIAAAFTILLGAWYRGMRNEVAMTNAREKAAWRERMETWEHAWRCERCHVVFKR